MAELGKELKKRFGDKIAVEKELRDKLYIRLDKDCLEEVVRHLFQERGGRLATISGVDKLEESKEEEGSEKGEQRIELLYHFAFDREGMITTLRTSVPRDDPKAVSISPIMPAAEFIEREINELLGVVFTGHPRPKRLIKAEDIPDDVYPLRKNFSIKEIEQGREG